MSYTSSFEFASSIISFPALTFAPSLMLAFTSFAIPKNDIIPAVAELSLIDGCAALTLTSSTLETLSCISSGNSGFKKKFAHQFLNLVHLLAVVTVSVFKSGEESSGSEGGSMLSSGLVGLFPSVESLSFANPKFKIALTASLS